MLVLLCLSLLPGKSLTGPPKPKQQHTPTDFTPGTYAAHHVGFYKWTLTPEQLRPGRHQHVTQALRQVILVGVRTAIVTVEGTEQQLKVTEQEGVVSRIGMHSNDVLSVFDRPNDSQATGWMGSGTT